MLHKQLRCINGGSSGFIRVACKNSAKTTRYIQIVATSLHEVHTLHAVHNLFVWHLHTRTSDISNYLAILYIASRLYVCYSLCCIIANKSINLVPLQSNCDDNASGTSCTVSQKDSKLLSNSIIPTIYRYAILHQL